MSFASPSVSQLWYRPPVVYPAIDPPFWARLVAALRAIDAAAIAREVQGQPSEIKLRLRHTRLDTLQPFS